MSILDRKPKRYSTSDLIWAPHAAPTDGTVGDMNTMKLDPSHLALAQDVIISNDGTVRSRGGLLTAAAAQSVQPLALLQSNATTGYVAHASTNQGSFYGTTTTDLTSFNRLTVMGEDGSNSTQNPSGDTSTYRWGAVRLPDQAGGIFCGGSFGSTFSAKISSFIWGGNGVTTGNTSTGTFTAGTNKSVTGAGTSWTSALNGSYLMTATAGAGVMGSLIGQVDTVTSTTALTLKTGANGGGTLTPMFKTCRMLQHAIYKGRITTSTASVTMIGANTKFASCIPVKNGTPTSYLASPAAGWSIHRLSDGALVGDVLTVINDTTVTLNGLAAINMTNEEYYITPNTTTNTVAGGIPINYFGAACAEYYADRYWYGCFYSNSKITTGSGNPTTWCDVQLPSSIVFSRKGFPELLDISATTGDIITFPNVQGYGGEVRCMKATRGGMLVFRGVDTYFLTGYSPETFRTIKVVDDGCLGNNFAKKYGEGVIWAGSKSIWYFDGTRVVDLLSNKIKSFYQQRFAVGLSTGTVGGSALANDHFMVSADFGGIAGQISWPVGNSTLTMNGVTIAINMVNGAVSFFTNGFFYDSSTVNLSNNAIEDIILAGDGSPASATAGQFIKGSKLFLESTTAADNIDAAQYYNNFTASNQLGPQVLFETIKYSMGDASRLKFFKMFLMNYMSEKSMTVVVSGTNQAAGFPNTATGTAVTTVFAANATNSILKRVKFLIRAPSLSVRVYQTAAPISTQSQKFKLFWYAVGGKFMRIGRAQ